MDLNLKACSLGIEFGSTRIKAVLIGPDYVPLASGSYTWKDHLEGQYWSYSLSEVKSGLQSCYAALKKEARRCSGCSSKEASIQSLPQANTTGLRKTRLGD